MFSISSLCLLLADLCTDAHVPAESKRDLGMLLCRGLKQEVVIESILLSTSAKG